MSDNSGTPIYKLNFDCFAHIMSYLRIEDVIALEATEPGFFGNITPHAYLRNHKLDLTAYPHGSGNILDFDRYPMSLWRKIGIYVTELTIRDFDTRICTFEVLFDCFPNVERLTLTNCHIRCDTPMLPRRLKALKLHLCQFNGQFDKIFDNISSTLTELSIGTLSTSQTSFTHALQQLDQVKQATLQLTTLTSTDLATFLTNNRDSLESLTLLRHPATTYDEETNILTEECYQNLNLLHKLTTLTSSYVYLDTDRLANSFCQQIERLSFYDFHEHVIFFLKKFSNVQSLSIKFVDLDDLQLFIAKTPTLQQIQIMCDSHLYSLDNPEDALAKLKMSLQTEKRKLEWKMVT